MSSLGGITQPLEWQPTNRSILRRVDVTSVGQATRYVCETFPPARRLPWTAMQIILTSSLESVLPPLSQKLSLNCRLRFNGVSHGGLPSNKSPIHCLVFTGKGFATLLLNHCLRDAASLWIIYYMLRMPHYVETKSWALLSVLLLGWIIIITGR